MDDVARRLEALYRERYPRYVRAMATITGSHESGHDAVQEGFARALRGRRGYRGGSLETWTWRILLRAARDQRVRPWTSLDEIDPVVLDPEANPELTAAVRLLPPRRRLVVFLRFYADLSYREIADLLGIDPGTVAATLAQSRAALERALQTDEVTT